MKLSDGFDARRLRPKGQRNWRYRFGAAIAALLAMAGVLLAMAGAASLLGHAPAMGELNTNRVGAAVILVVLFMYRPATTWPGLVIVVLGLPVYLLLRRRIA